jgi:hypothetical protein
VHRLNNNLNITDKTILVKFLLKDDEFEYIKNKPVIKKTALWRGKKSNGISVYICENGLDLIKPVLRDTIIKLSVRAKELKIIRLKANNIDYKNVKYYGYFKIPYGIIRELFKKKGFNIYIEPNNEKNINDNNEKYHYNLFFNDDDNKILNESDIINIAKLLLTKYAASIQIEIFSTPL